jgi:RND family efflux transporter MFP subunit
MFGLGGATAKTETPAAAPTAMVEIRDIDYKVVVSGDVQPVTQLDIKAEVGGHIKTLNVVAGSKVKAGDALLEIDPVDIMTERDTAVTEIEGATLEVDRTEKDFTRAKDLFAQKLMTQEKFDDTASAFALAKNSLAKSQRRKQLVDDKLTKTKVMAPGVGTVLTMTLVPGQVIIPAASVNSGTTLMTIANLSTLLVETHVNQVDVERIREGQDVTLVAESIRDSEMLGKISFIAPVATVKNSVKGFTVQAIIEKPSPRLRPGMSVQMTVPVAHVEDVVTVPVRAVFRGENNSRVVYVFSKGKTERRVVKVGVSNVDFAQIVQGLSKGEEILLAEPERTPRKRS